MRRDRPRFRLGVSDYAGLTLLPGLMKTVLALAPHATVEAALAGAGQVRRIALISQSFAANFAAAAQSDLLATVPAHLASTLPRGLVTRRVPFAVAPFDYGMIWHPRTDAAPAPRWLRRVIAGLVREPAGQMDHTG